VTCHRSHHHRHCLPTRRSSDLTTMRGSIVEAIPMTDAQFGLLTAVFLWIYGFLSPLAGFMADRLGKSRVVLGSLFVWSAVTWLRSEEHTSELQSRENLVCRLLL